MSVRLMKKILKEQEEAAASVPQQLNNDDESESESESPPPPPPATFRNPFDLLDEEEEDTVDQGRRQMEYMESERVSVMEGDLSPARDLDNFNQFSSLALFHESLF